MHHKKGQITIFIIIGILIVSALTYFISVKTKTSSIEETPQIEDVPEELQPVNAYVQGCIILTAKQGLKILGMQGGYINVSRFGLSHNDFSPTKGRSVRLLPDSNIITAYWSHLDGDPLCESPCSFRTEIPPLYKKDEKVEGKSVESQLDDYISDNLNNCLGGFEAFKQRGFVVEPSGKISVRTKILDDKVSVYVDYPVSVSKDNHRSDIKAFVVDLDVPLKKMYKAALEITRLEIKRMYLERHALNLISGFSAVDSDKLPPFAESKIGFGDETFWIKSQVKENIKNVLTSYVQLLQVYGSRNYELRSFGDELLSAIYNQGMQIPVNASVRNFDITFSYLPVWDIFLNMNCKGEYCGPESAGTNILPIPVGLQRYRFSYDLSFPVMVEITDPDSLDMEGYSFVFFLESNIRKNVPANSTVPDFSVTGYENMFCDLEQRNSGNITIRLKDKLTQAPISDAVITYTCGKDSCSIGTTDQKGMYEGPFPICFEGFITVMKSGYITKSVPLATRLDKENSVDVYLDSLKEFRFDIEKKRFTKGNGWQFRDSPSPFYDQEIALLTITRYPESPGEHEYVVVRSYNSTEGSVSLAEGKYLLEISTFYNGDLVIPERKKTIDGGLFGDDEEITIPEVRFDKIFPTGGVRINFSVSKEMLDYNKIIFYTISPDMIAVPEASRTIEDLEFVTDIDGYSAQYGEKVQPGFLR